ncbi:MAG: hypothetical protein OQK25_03000 [Gammaproteobacteria bacterium]|nr:hypothetical protein [Gammaproteobacteria bacterium]
MKKTFDVLLIEDDSVESQRIGSILDDGFIHLIQYSVNSELERSELPNRHFDVAIIDIDTLDQARPSSDKILHQLQQYNSDCLMIVLTADASQESIKPLLDLNIRKFITKPYCDDDILNPIYQRIGMNFQDFQQQVNYEHRIIDKRVIEIKELIAIKAIEGDAQHLFSKKVDQLIKLVSEHFSLEERHMMLYRYPDLDVHQQQHHSLLEDLKELVDFSHNHHDDVHTHLEIINKVEIKLDHDHHFMDFVTNLGYLNSEFATS